MVHYAAAGAQIGGGWGALIGAVLGIGQGVLTSIFKSEAAEKAAYLGYFSINRGSGNSNILKELAEFQPDMEIFAQYSLSAMIDNEAAQKEFTEYLDTQDWLK